MLNTLAPVSQLRTPYHALGSVDGPRVPEWAEHRSVYRAAGRTLYRVETTQLEQAGDDLSTLRNRGWDVHIEAAGPDASISLTRAA